MPKGVPQLAPAPRPHSPRMLDWSALNCRLLWIYEARPDPFGRAGVFEHTHTKAWLVTKGWAQMEQADHVVRATPGEWLVSTPGRHRQRFGEDTEILSVCFHAAWPDNLSLFETAKILRLDASAHPDLASLARNLLEIARPLFPPGYDYSTGNISLQTQPCDFLRFARVQQHFIAWLACFYRVMDSAGATETNPRAEDARITKILNVLDNWPLEKPLGRDHLGRLTNLTPKHLDRLFASVLGTTPLRYLERRRLRQVCQYLIERGVPIKEAAYELGFRSEVHFSHWFRRNVGLSPKQFRERNASR